jgi:sugar transferase (PEP-CTERM/EpsH1 system associated)
MTAVLTPNTDAQSITREDPPTSPRVLMLTHRLPYPPDRGDRIRSYHMLKELARHFEVGIACTSDEPVWLQHHQLLSTIAKRVAIQPISVHASKIASLGAFITGRSITPSYYYRQGLADTILQWHEEAPFDVVLTFCTGMIRYARLLVPGPAGRPQPKATNTTPSRHILDLVDVDSLKWDSYAQQTWPPMRWAYRAEARRLGKIEAGKSDHFDAVTVISDAEAEAYRNQIVDHPGLTVVNNGVDLDYFETLPDADTKTLVFVGVLNYKPNAEGITWFVQHVMGLLRRQLPDARLLIIGRHPTPRIEELAHQPGVEVIGSVPDVRIYLREACAAIAPLRIARGVQNKVLEAMACNRAVVCSTQAAQGLRARHEEHLLVADTAQQWVDHLYRVMTDTETRQRIATAARRQVEDCYSWESCLRPIVQLIRGDQPPHHEGG